VNGNLQGVPLGEALAAAREKVEELHLKPGYQAVFGGSAATLAEASSNFTIALVLAVIFIYMVLASQFNSFVHPLTIMTALPLSLPAGLLALMAFGMTINVYSAIGLMMLFGIVKKNSILQVDYTNTLPRARIERHEAAHPCVPRAPAPDSDDQRSRSVAVHSCPSPSARAPRRLRAPLDGGDDSWASRSSPGADASGDPVRYSNIRHLREWSPKERERAGRLAASRRRRRAGRRRGRRRRPVRREGFGKRFQSTSTTTRPPLPTQPPTAFRAYSASAFQPSCKLAPSNRL
jgi:hypothetical protein